MFPRLHSEGISSQGRNVPVIEDHGVLALVYDLVYGGFVETSLLRVLGLHRAVDCETGGVGQLGVVQVIAAQALPLETLVGVTVSHHLYPIAPSCIREH